ncbi:BnaAnng04620D [Brassica napus]|uniref:BnaAnng04620D protein n=1 Tax=Brassica napus TaxID=3708 RepID=A0A078HJS8_BRANA|nr:BnaAnng04620D [Brassica napus]
MEENDIARRPPCVLPERIFAVGEEPAGVRVTPYHKAGAIRQIIAVLDPDEVEHIRVSPFGKLLEIADKPSFSGRFGRYIISRQLKVAKKHEAWFLFAGKPIRFSIRKFALVTGLNCRKFPKKSKKKSKNFMTKKPYWEVPVSSVLRMLEQKTIVDKDIRLKYTYLSLLAAVILPTTHAPRISKECAEKIKDLDAILAYPWGRVSFDMLMSSIKERKEVSLSQNTIALKGFVLALQLVIVECVPALTEVVHEGGSSGSDDDDTNESDKLGRKGISPGHARDTDAAEKALIQSVMLDANGETNVPPEYEWTDDEDDAAVSNMLNLIDQRFGFNSHCFVGGTTKQEVHRMREEAKAELVGRKTVKTKAGTSSHRLDGVDIDLLASIVSEKMKDDFQLLHGDVSSIQESANAFTETILANINEVFCSVQDRVHQIATLSADIRNLEATVSVSPPQMANNQPNVVHVGTQTVPDVPTIISDAINFANRSTQSDAGGGQNGLDASTAVGGVTNKSVRPSFETAHLAPECAQKEHLKRHFTRADHVEALDPALLFPNPTFSLGLTQETRVERPKEANVTVDADHEGVDEDDDEASAEEAPPACRKSKRQKVPTKSLMGEKECDKGFLHRARKAVTDAIYKGGTIDYSAKFAALMDKLKTPFDLTTDRGIITSNQLYEVVERATQLSPQVLDVLIFHTSALFVSRSSLKQIPIVVFMDTKFLSHFTKLYTKFSKLSRKDGFKFTPDIVDMFLQLPSYADAVRFYSPFFVDKKYWVTVCVDCSSWTVTVLDCNTALRSDYMMTKDVRPIASLFPYLLKQVGREVGTRDGKAMRIERPRTTP